MKSRRPIPITDEPFPLFPRLIATSFGAGFLPVAPGTWGAIVGIILWLPLYLWCPGMPAFIATAALTLFFTVAGTWASSVSEKYWGKDPVAACVDETVGQLLSLLPLCGGHGAAPWWLILVSLALFRFFDIFKPLGIRSMERFPGGFGMMADDILAAVYAVAIEVVILLLI